MTDMNVMNEMELTKVTGGANPYQTEYKYHVGQRIEVYSFLWFTRSATILDTGWKTWGVAYYIRYSNGTLEWIAEHEIQD